MSSPPNTPPTPPPTTAPTPPGPTPAEGPAPSFPAAAGKAIRELPRPAKIGLIALALALVVAVYIWMGRVTTDDAQVDAHITVMASQVSGYVVQLSIDDNTDVKEGDVLVQIDNAMVPSPFICPG